MEFVRAYRQHGSEKKVCTGTMRPPEHAKNVWRPVPPCASRYVQMQPLYRAVGTWLSCIKFRSCIQGNMTPDTMLDVLGCK